MRYQESMIRLTINYCGLIGYCEIIPGYYMLKPNTNPSHGSSPPWGSNLFLDKKVANPERSESMNTFKNNNY